MFTQDRFRRRSRAMIALCLGFGLLTWGSLALGLRADDTAGRVYWAVCVLLAAAAVIFSTRELMVSLLGMQRKCRAMQQRAGKMGAVVSPSARSKLSRTRQNPAAGF